MSSRRQSSTGADDPRVRDEATPIAVERIVTWLRVAVVASGTVLFPLVADRPEMMPRLAYALLALGWAYALFILFYEPYRRYPVLASTWFTTASDVAITIVWLAATGGVGSWWSIALQVTIALASFRCRPRDTVILGVTAAAGYVVMAAVMGQLEGAFVQITVRVFYIVLLAAVCATIAHAQHGRFAARLDALDLTEEVAQVGSWEWGIPDGSLSWSAELRRIFGVPASYQPTVEAFFGAIHPDDLASVKSTIETAVAERKALRFDHRIVTRDGRIRMLHCRGHVVLDEAGTPVRVVGSTQDVTDARAMQEQLLVTRKLASLGTLASGIAHEINNPLAYVSTNLALARRELAGADRTKVASALDAAEDGCRRVADIVRGLKTFSRADDDETRPVDLAAIADSALAIAAHEIAQRARLVREYGDAPAVVGSESRLVQVVLNLVVNAAQAIGGGSRDDHEIRVRLGRAVDGRACIEVSDTGCGIPEAHLAKVFDPFFTTKPPGVGTGLGLSICHGIVRDLGGEISVETDVGRGATFRVLLPAAPADAARREDVRPEPEPKDRRLRVLVVDDEVAFARSLRLLLGEQHDVVVESDGRSALATLTAGERFDIVLCDLMMAGMSGMDLHDVLASEHPNVVPRIVFLTGGATNDRARAFLARSDVRHLEKPVELPVLEGTIRAVVQDSAPS